MSHHEKGMKDKTGGDMKDMGKDTKGAGASKGGTKTTPKK